MPPQPAQHVNPPHRRRQRQTRRAPITPLCSAATVADSRPVAAPNGGSARVIHALCCPVGGRPASPRKSQTKSQRRPTSADTQRRQATVKPGQVPAERHQATPSDGRNVTGGQGVAGSNPAVPTGSEIFSNIVTPHKSQQKSHLVVQWPFQRRADRVPRRPIKACANMAEPAGQGAQTRPAHVPAEDARLPALEALRTGQVGGQA